MLHNMLMFVISYILYYKSLSRCACMRSPPINDKNSHKIKITIITYNSRLDSTTHIAASVHTVVLHAIYKKKTEHA